MSGDCIVKDSYVSINTYDPKMRGEESDNMTHSERTINQSPLLPQPANPSNEGCSPSSRGGLRRYHRRQKEPQYFSASSRHSLK